MNAAAARILRDGAVLSLVASIFLLALLRFNPRMFLQHFPKEIREVAPPRTASERRLSGLLGLLIGAPLGAAFLWRSSHLGSRSFPEIFAYAFGVLSVFNVVDLLILDWLIVCRLKPRWANVPGTEHIVVPRPYLHHFKGFLTGCAGLLIAALTIAALLSSRTR